MVRDGRGIEWVELVGSESEGSESEGSGSPVPWSDRVVVRLPVAADTPQRLCDRNLIYTGVTRAKRLLVLAGDRATLHAMIANDKKMLRYSCLTRLLQDNSVF